MEPDNFAPVIGSYYGVAGLRVSHGALCVMLMPLNYGQETCAFAKISTHWP
jgi:hypothetical protein